MDKKLHDITTEEHVEFLIKTFYGRLLQDEFMAPHFKEVNFEEHFPRMTAFWNFILLDKAGYTGNVFEKHVHLQINEAHFDRWIMHFTQTLHDFFEGEKATLAKQRAEVLKFTFLSKMPK
ncbi:MAG TPA: group III truncated hemoglobin [Bacteroidia bacterium]|nr:group III truncated hemoglobin [Bacteroidia bacterium]